MTSMKMYEKLAIAAGLVVVGITAVYRHVLTEEQRDAMREASDAVGAVAREVTDVVKPLVSDSPTKTQEEEAAAANRARTAAQWEALGY